MMNQEAENLLKSKCGKEDYEKLKAIDNPAAERFIAEAVEICNPDDIFICSDSPDEIAYIRHKAIAGEEEKAALETPGHTYHLDGPRDQGRDRENTKFLVPEDDSLSKALEQTDRKPGLEEVKGLLRDSMEGRTMIVRFLTLGPPDSEFTIPCLECTDSWYVAHCVDLLYRTGYETFLKTDPDREIFKTLHSAGELDENMVSKNPEDKRIYIDYKKNNVYSVNTQYAGNSVGFKKLALRLAIRKAHREGWLAEHFMIMGVEGPGDRKTYLAGGFPSACGKTSTAMLPGENILADDISYVRNIDGVCRGANIESGVLGILQDVSPEDDPLIWEVLHEPGEIIFTNVLIRDAKPWWLGMGRELPEEGINYTGEWWEGKTNENGEEVKPSHKNARYAMALEALPNCDPELHNPEGVELEGIFFGGRDYQGYVPIQQGYDWSHGIIAYGAALETETTFATIEEEGQYEINMMSIQDFVSIPLGEYLENYLDFGARLERTPPVFGANYFLKDSETGDFLNAIRDKHVWVKWMELRVHDDVGAIKSPTGLLPKYEDLRKLFSQVLDKDYPREGYKKQFTIRVPQNLKKVERVKKFYREEAKDVPDKLFEVLNNQKNRLQKSQEKYGDYIPPSKFE
ncbi:phosphoenolpyruvate carboxykinase [candidate division MSBL1 archaeon SCGC-AAA259E17]|uniref:Phosphoenolpyruvate carboxykinase [GTP] n=1 Tax=candidate division MSBL1 archaeon SCGC-AAA259E17 TaxID=1698263 RepID=A0A133UHI4_9EURY|nr:phosphoenolpyruvate carboxykinase [candidate division MSBL1 archaeon SCGC-AAA259E17]